ncbi:MAG: NusG domain II-containing protein [Ruminococcaceae bacterium]|nr:NusG domain II-containing protein [Oscillospiraceae bacterium]
MNGKKAKNDIIFISALLVFALIFGLVLFLSQTKGDTVVVTVDGALFGEYPIEKDAQIEIKSKSGENLLVIKDKTADVISASCPDGICVHHRPIQNGGESIICLPNKVVVEVRTKGVKGTDIIV